jgi:allophanate hydrolase
MSLSIAELLRAYRSNELRPSEVAARICERVERQPIWISKVGENDLLAAAAELDEAENSLPLYGVPFAVKDNIDVAGLATTAGCPGIAYLPESSAPVVERLLRAGALLVGKTNLDQFATGLVGTRSPYGACSSVFDAERVSGGSSSGSALAVALGMAAFSLGTDTAGSGRVPAAFNGLVGLKPTRGLISTRGLVPACASLDCVSVFANSVRDAGKVFDVAVGFDSADPWSRSERACQRPRREVIGVPPADIAERLEAPTLAAWNGALERAAEKWSLVEVDVSPLLRAAPLLYDAWVAERTTDLAETIASAPEGLDSTVAKIVAGGAERSAVDVFAAIHRLAGLARAAAPMWEEIDALLLPTTPIHPTHAEVAADPVAVNERLGQFTNFVNPLDLAALALPAPPREDGLPFGVTLLAPAFCDRRLLELGAAWLGEDIRVALPDALRLAVVGAHMSGLPLNPELTELGGRLLRADRTAPLYRLYALPGATVKRPGLMRVDRGGESIELELWELSPPALGALLCKVPAPLSIGRVTLEDGAEVAGFLCEAHAVAEAEDVSAHGGWRAYLAAA